jgi:hypothetical protein
MQLLFMRQDCSDQLRAEVCYATPVYLGILPEEDVGAIANLVESRGPKECCCHQVLNIWQERPDSAAVYSVQP